MVRGDDRRVGPTSLIHEMWSKKHFLLQVNSVNFKVGTTSGSPRGTKSPSSNLSPSRTLCGPTTHLLQEKARPAKEEEEAQAALWWAPAAPSRLCGL